MKNWFTTKSKHFKHGHLTF